MSGTSEQQQAGAIHPQTQSGTPPALCWCPAMAGSAPQQWLWSCGNYRSFSAPPLLSLSQLHLLQLPQQWFWWVKPSVCCQCPVPRLRSQPVSALLARWPVLALAKEPTRPSCHQHRKPGAGRKVPQAKLLIVVPHVGICWRGRATRALLSDLRGIWLENVWFCSRLGAI